MVCADHRLAPMSSAGRSGICLQDIAGHRHVGVEPYPRRQLTSGRLFGYLARRPGNRAPPHGAPGEERARQCKRWASERGAARNGER